jgi:hypothetical protein
MDLPGGRRRVLIYDLTHPEGGKLSTSIKCGYTVFAIAFTPGGELLVGESNCIRVFRRRE